MQALLESPKFHLDHTLPALEEGWIFVFGSNLAGRHGKGAAKVAKAQFGAQPGLGVGLCEHSYAIATKDAGLRVLALDRIALQIETFCQFVSANPQLKFWISRVGCGLAGYEDKEIAPLFRPALSNCSYSVEWREYLV